MKNNKSEKHMPADPFIAFGKKFLKKGRCFLCGCKLTGKNTTEEHVFPKWLLKRYSLFNSGGLTLLNGRTQAYRKIKVPCCMECNNVHLGRLEREISSAVRSGYNAFVKLDEEKVYLWLLKIFYEIVYLETSLMISPGFPEKGRMITPAKLEEYAHCHVFLQAIRGKTTFHDQKPWSIFIFKTKKYSNPLHNFDYKDNLDFLTFAIRMDGIGIIACLQDNGSHKDCFVGYDKIRNHTLHSIQFIETFSKVTYKESTCQRVPKYVMIGDKSQCQVISMPRYGLSTKPIYGDWDMEVYARYLSAYLQLPFEGIYVPPGKVMSWVEDEKGRFKNLDRIARNMKLEKGWESY